jgi:hypothetical protein
MARETRMYRDIMAGCYVCNPDRYLWYGKNAQAVAARHHDATGHTCWVDVHLCYEYGPREIGQPAPEEAKQDD